MGVHKASHEPGAYLRLALPDGSYGYGRLLQSPFAAFYRRRSSRPGTDTAPLDAEPVLFKVAIRRSALDRWDIIGAAPLDEELQRPIVQFKQDVGHPLECRIIDSAGHDRAAAPDECVGLERAVVWDGRHVEQRVLDAILGRANAIEELLRVQIP
jgi:hypothetical protein